MIATDQEFHDLLTAYEHQSAEAIRLRHEAARLEIERATWVNEEAARILATGGSATAAEKAAHAAPTHRDYQRLVADRTMEADQADRRARCSWLALTWEIAGRQAPTVTLIPERSTP